MKIYKHRIFENWATSEGICDATLREAVFQINAGLFEANLGAGLYKKRIARPGQGKRDGYRTLVAFKQDDRAVFLFGFAKNDKENIEEQQLSSLKRLAKDYLSASMIMINKAIKEGRLIEVKYDA